MDSDAAPQRAAAADDSIPIDLLNALARLSFDARMVIRLVSIEGLTHAEAADVLAVPDGTVASRLHYAPKRLAEFGATEIPSAWWVEPSISPAGPFAAARSGAIVLRNVKRLLALHRIGAKKSRPTAICVGYAKSTGELSAAIG